MTYHSEEDPEGDRPFERRDDESGQQRSHVGRQDDKSRPDVDLASSLVEEEHVEDEHQTTSLSHGAEEPIQNTSCHEGLESGRSSTPRRGGGREDQEVKQDWEATCPR